MEFKGLFDLQLMMFLLMGTGMFLRKKNIITKEGRGVLTDLIINVLLPCNIITAFSIPLTVLCWYLVFRSLWSRCSFSCSAPLSAPSATKSSPKNRG